MKHVFVVAVGSQSKERVSSTSALASSVNRYRTARPRRMLQPASATSSTGEHGRLCEQQQQQQPLAAPCHGGGTHKSTSVTHTHPGRRHLLAEKWNMHQYTLPTFGVLQHSRVYIIHCVFPQRGYESATVHVKHIAEVHCARSTEMHTSTCDKMLNRRRPGR